MLNASDLHCISRSYEIDFGTSPIISSVAGGDVSEAYLIEGNDEIHFIKKVKIKSMPRCATAPHKVAFEYIDFQEEIATQLSDTLPTVAATPSKTEKGKFYTKSNSHILLVYRLTKGTSKYDSNVSLDMVSAIAKSLALLHSSQPKFDKTIAQEKLEQYKNIGLSVINSSIWKILPKIPFLEKNFPSLFFALNHISQHHSKLSQAIKDISKVAICHNDLKPKNILWEDSGDFWIIDWDAAGLFDIEADHLDTALAWATHYTDGNLLFFPEKLNVFAREYPFCNSKNIEHSLNLVIIKWYYWLIFCLKKILLSQGEFKKNIYNINYALSFIKFLAQNDMKKLIAATADARPTPVCSRS